MYLELRLKVNNIEGKLIILKNYFIFGWDSIVEICFLVLTFDCTFFLQIGFYCDYFSILHFSELAFVSSFRFQSLFCWTCFFENFFVSTSMDCFFYLRSYLRKQTIEKSSVTCFLFIRIRKTSPFFVWDFILQSFSVFRDWNVKFYFDFFNKNCFKIRTIYWTKE